MFEHSFVDKDKDWRGLSIVHSPKDDHFPVPGSLDLLHESFIDVKRIKKTPETRLNQYDHLMKNNGWFMFAHIDNPLYMGPTYFTDWLENKAYPYIYFSAPRGNVPEDYPRTRWWNNFRQMFRIGKKVSPNFLLVAQKISPKKTPFKNHAANFFEQSL